MKLEEQCVSLELAKQLKELKVKQESYFWWNDVDDGDGHRDQWIDSLDGRGNYSAFTVAELGGMLPDGDGKDCHGYFTMENVAYEYYPEYNEHCEIYKFGIWEKTEADARAKLLIHLIEKGIIKINE